MGQTYAARLKRTRAQLREALESLGVATDALKAKAGGIPDADILVAQLPNSGYSDVLRQPNDPDSLLKQYREWVYACAIKNANGVARTPLRLYVAKPEKKSRLLTRTKAVGLKQLEELSGRDHLQRYFRKAAQIDEVLEHPFYSLWENGNPHLTGTQLKLLIDLHMDLVGDCFAFIVKEDEIPASLLILPPGRVSVVTDDDGRIRAYRLRKGGEEIDIAASEVAHFKHPDPANHIYGLSPLEAIGLAATLYHKYNEFEVSLIDNDAMPGALIVAPEGMGADQRERLERKWNRKYSGPRRTGKLAVVSGAIEIKALGLSQKDMQFTQGRRLARTDIAAAFDVPLGLLTTEDVNKANAEVAETQHARHAIRTRCALIEDQINRDIMPFYDENIFVAFDNPIPEDRQYELQKETVYLEKGVVTINEVRHREGKEPVPWGDEPLLQAGVMPFGASPHPIGERPGGGGSDEVPPPAETLGAQKSAPGIERPDPYLMRVLERFFDEQRRELEKQYTAIPGERRKGLDIAILLDDAWLARLQALTEPILFDAIDSGEQAGANQVRRRVGTGVAFDVQREQVQEFVQQYTFRFAQSVNESTQKMLRGVLRQGLSEGLSDRTIARRMIDHVFGDEMSFKRAMRIARTEEARAVSAGTIDAYKQSGVVGGKQWLTTSDACEFCVAVAAEFNNVALDANFLPEGTILRGVSGGTMTLDYGAISHPPLHPNCKCAVVPLLVGEV